MTCVLHTDKQNRKICYYKHRRQLTIWYDGLPYMTNNNIFIELFPYYTLNSCNSTKMFSRVEKLLSFVCVSECVSLCMCVDMKLHKNFVINIELRLKHTHI